MSSMSVVPGRTTSVLAICVMVPEVPLVKAPPLGLSVSVWSLPTHRAVKVTPPAVTSTSLGMT